jgi:hypothetical protein
MRPNFVFILADDLGYADLGCYGGRTPCSAELDRLAADGLRFTDGYSNSPVCSPTRFALMTGRFQYRLRGGNDEPIASRTAATRAGPAAGPPDAAVAAARRRLHDGARRQVAPRLPAALRPLKSGYREFFGPMSGGLDYFTHRDSAGQHDLFEGEAESPPSAISPISSPSARGLHRPAARQARRPSSVGPLHGAALALGNAR